MANEIKPVVIPREVAQAIEVMRSEFATTCAYSNEDIARVYTDSRYSDSLAKSIRKLPFDTLMRALLDGYERERTPEETVAEIYRKLSASADQERRAYNGEPTQYLMAALAVKRVLDVLGIVIPGVNVPEQTEGGAA
ncbi:DUF1642 domain-containing protein [Paenibacillus sp. 7124]|uniref:DUF1642 domain-containing protein n=1 Tax=Paenibacillus apii TaxID=1850370 RepID=A0A6M1PDB5_9BACL|nr:DUF1642 domain-containing protein [Paenibacillus apii]NGM81269.1 DUF1642 domain-containing protein [Paenibacillus apii]